MPFQQIARAVYALLWAAFSPVAPANGPRSAAGITETAAGIFPKCGFGLESDVPVGA